LTDGKETRPININTDSVNIYLQAQQTSVEPGGSATLIFSGTSYVTNNKELTIQLLIQVPAGVFVSGARDAQEGSGSQFSTVKKLKPGEQESIGISIAFSNPGRYDVTAEAIYYFGENRNSGDGTRVTIPIKQQPRPPSTADRVVEIAEIPFVLYKSSVAALSSPVASGSYFMSYFLAVGVMAIFAQLPFLLFRLKPMVSEGSYGGISIERISIVMMATFTVGLLFVSTALPKSIRLYLVPRTMIIFLLVSILYPLAWTLYKYIFT
jgi:hypothetical protein